MKKRSPPPPDRPLNIHSTAYRPSHDFTEPNWGKWKLYDNVPLWIAACLLANIDPPADTYELDGYPANFKEIWNIINSDGDFANVPNLPLDGRRNYVASLRGFAAWAINKGIENIPETMLEWGHQRLKLLAEIKAMPEQNIEPVTSAAPPPASKPQAAAASEPVTPIVSMPEQTDDAGLSRREKQIRAIVSAINTLGLSAMNIPTGQKNKVRDECKRVTDLFGGGNDPFKEAWQEALNQNRVRTEKHDQYSRK